MNDEKPLESKSNAGESEEEACIGQVSELLEPDENGTLVSRRDMVRAAAALGMVAADEEIAQATGRGTISYVLCNRAFNEPVVHVEFSPGGGRLGALSQSGKLLVWDSGSLGKPLEHFTAANVDSFTWGFRETLVVRDRQGHLRCYDGSGKSIYEWPKPGITMAGFSPEGRWLVLLEGNQTLYVIETGDWRLAHTLQVGNSVPTGLASIGATGEQHPRAYLAGRHEVLLIEPDSGKTSSYPEHAGSDFSGVIVGSGSEKAALLNGRSMTILTFPGGVPWGDVVDLGAVEGVETCSPGLDFMASVTKDGHIRVRSLVGANSGGEVPADAVGVTCLAWSRDPLSFAWGGRDGRVVVHKTSGVIASSNLAAAIDAGLGKIKPFVPSRVKLEYSDCTCTCNSVEVTSTSNDRMTQTWDAERQTWMNSTQPCGAPIPRGAVCVCNCVAAESTPIWTTVCTCNTVCTCESVGSGSGGYMLTYWY